MSTSKTSGIIILVRGREVDEVPVSSDNNCLIGGPVFTVEWSIILYTVCVLVSRVNIVLAIYDLLGATVVGYQLGGRFNGKVPGWERWL